MNSLNLRNERIGTVNKNKNGSTMKIIIYTNKDNIFVEFEKGKPVHTNWVSFLKGSVKSPFDKTVCGIGYIGEGDHKAHVNKVQTPQYTAWRNMITRCYSKKYQERQPTYKECSVDSYFHNFQNFAKWYNQNYYEIEGETMALDKDILIKGNKIYSPKTCVFVPQIINQLFTKTNAKRGKFPIGVVHHKKSGKYVAKGAVPGGHIGIYNTVNEAFLAYKNAKENLIKEVANDYKNKIPLNLYNALINYRVEITD